MSETQIRPPLQVDQKDERMWAMFCHLSALAGFVGVPFGNILGPLVVWLIKKNTIPLVDAEGKKSLNFQILMTILFVVAAMLIVVLIGFPLMIALAIADFILVIIAGIKANNGEDYKYPFEVKFIK